MAMKHIKIDDLTGAEAPDAEEYRVRLGDIDGDLHLTASSHAALAALVNGEGAGKLTALLTPRKAPSRAPGSGASAAKIRAWADANGIELRERGRIPAEIREKYNAANR